MTYDSRLIETKTAKLFRETDKLHVILKIALNDIKKVEKSKKFQIHMGTWFSPSYDDGKTKCMVCAAGAVMAMTFKAPKENCHGPDDFYRDDQLKQKFNALDSLRSGQILSAWEDVHGSDETFPGTAARQFPTHYYYSPEDKDGEPDGNARFWETMNALLAYLQKEDL